jgi:hypothetical protein
MAVARFRNISNRDVVADFGVIGGKRLVKTDGLVSVLDSVAPAYELLTKTWQRDDPMPQAVVEASANDAPKEETA